MLRRTLSSLAHAALGPVRGARQLVQQGQAHQHFWLPVLNGALGDQLAARHDARAIRLSFRRGGLDVAVAELDLRGARQQTVVFVHGLMGDEFIWQAGPAEAPGAPPRYGPRLAAEAGVCALYVRYNSGLHISENGRALSQLLTELGETYPEAVGELVLVGHSMGGLVVRSAGYYGQAPATPPDKAPRPTPQVPPTEQLPAAEDLATAAEAPWLAHLRAVFLLGVPHDGSYLEQNSAAIERLLRRIDLLPTRLAGDAFALRSNGIKDLGQALLVEADWQRPPTDPAQLQPRTPVPLLPGVAYHVLVGAWLRAGRAQTLRDYFGDGLVGTASGRGGFDDETPLPTGTRVRTVSFGQQHHTGLLHHEAVYQYLGRWIREKAQNFMP